MVAVALRSVVLAATNPSLSASPALTVSMQKAATGGFVRSTVGARHPVRRGAACGRWALGRWLCPSPSVRASGGGTRDEERARGGLAGAARRRTAGASLRRARSGATQGRRGQGQRPAAARALNRIGD
jgi:hypothetical protein